MLPCSGSSVHNPGPSLQSVTCVRCCRNRGPPASCSQNLSENALQSGYHLAEHLHGHTVALSLQAWRCEACECWVPRAAGGEAAWRAHVQGIRHRRQALSLLHTGARGNLLLSAFERLPGACLGLVFAIQLAELWRAPAQGVYGNWDFGCAPL